MVYIIAFLLFAIYFLPIVIYRYAFRKAPVEAKRAKNIVKLHFIFFATALSLLFRLPVYMGMIWVGLTVLSYLNYRVLTGGSMKPDITVKVDEPQNFDVVYEDFEYEVSDKGNK